MKKLTILFFILSFYSTAQSSEPNISQLDKKEECVLIAQLLDPKQKDEHPIQLCIYTHTEVRGIFAATACVAVLVESQTGTRHPFYGSNGHWGIEGTCDAKKIEGKFRELETMKTVNPVSDVKMKRKAGKNLVILKDDFKVGPTLLEVTKP
jgi:hypothetical protein